MTEKELMNEAYEWRKHIKSLVTATDDELYHKRSKVFDWLIEQVEQLQQKKDLAVEGFKQQVELVVDCVKENTELRKQLQQAQAKAERYEILFERVVKFMIDNEITCEETIYQCDWVIENAYEFIGDLFNIVELELPMEGLNENAK